MEAEKRFYTTAEVQKILSVSRTTANQIMHMFEKRGQLFRTGNTLRVEIETFEEWIRQNTSRPAWE